MSEGAFYTHKAGKHFIFLYFVIYCSFHHDEAGFFKCFCFIWKLWISWGRYQFRFLILPTASSNHVGGAVLSLYDSLQPSVFKSCWIYIENCEKLWSKHSSCWNLSVRSFEAGEKEFYQFIISLCLMREMKIRFISFSVFQFILENFEWGREVYHFMDLMRGTRELTQI